MPRVILEDDPRAIAWREAHKLAGGSVAVGQHFGITRYAVDQWDICPPERVVEVERLSGVSRYLLRPDVFGDGPTPTPAVQSNFSIRQALAEFGKRKLAEALNLSVEEIDEWPSVPAKFVLPIEKVTGLSRHALRPDIFGEAPEGSSNREVA